MTDVLGSLTYLRVTAKHGLAVADSNDTGDQPDWIPSTANVVISPIGLDKPFVIAGNPAQIITPTTITCKMVGGMLYGPANGQNIVTGETPALPVDILNPLDGGLSDVGWAWSASFTPSDPNQQWAPFTIVFNQATEDDGITVNLATAALMPVNTKSTPVPIIWPVTGDGTNAPAEPAQALIGQLVLDTTTWKLYQKGA